MLRKPSSTAFKAIIGFVMFAFIITSCNSGKKEETKETEKTEEVAPAPAPATNDTLPAADDTGKGKPGATGNKDAGGETAPAPSN